MIGRPTPILKGKQAKKFFENINDSTISDEQQHFLDECTKMLEELKN